MKVVSMLCMFPLLLAGCGFSTPGAAIPVGTMGASTPGLSSYSSAATAYMGGASCDSQAYNRLFFAILDENHDGQITEQELHDAFLGGFLGSPAAGWQPGQIQQAVQQTMTRYDTDHDGTISEAEYLAHATVPSDPEAYGRLLFAVVDRNHDGRVTEQELLDAAPLFGEPVGGWKPGELEQSIQQAMAKLDTDRDGFLTYAEFKAGLPACGA